MASDPTKDVKVEKYVYHFGELKTADGKMDKGLLGGKGAGLFEMTAIGLPVPPGFTITTKACLYYQKEHKWPATLQKEVDAQVDLLEKTMGRKIGDHANPLLVAVRSGAKFSMPGMMDTVLNLGLNLKAVEGMAKQFNDKRFPLDCYRRFIQMFGTVVTGVEHKTFEDVMELWKGKRKIKTDAELNVEELEGIVKDYLVAYEKHVKKPFPQDPKEQLVLAINAVFDSWDNDRAVIYRNINKIPHDLGTAVNVMSMVFGNRNYDSGTGVAFTRNPSTGENKRYGEYLTNAQGEDVVAGIRTPKQLEDMKVEMPEMHKQLYNVFNILEKNYRDMQDIEFTMEDKKLYLLQCRSGKRTAAAAVNIAVDMVHEKLITEEEAVLRVTPQQLDSLLHKQFDPKAKAKVKCITKSGVAASPGAAVGQIVFTSEKAVTEVAAGKAVVLVRLETSPEDIQGMVVAQGILTQRGGATSHAAVVARGLNIPCVAGCGELEVNEAKGTVIIAGKTYNEMDWLSIDGSTAEVFEGQLGQIEPKIEGHILEFLKMCQKISKLEVRANADTPVDAKVACDFGAHGIGLCRTEHMFFDPARIMVVRKMILAPNGEERKKALDELLPFQQKDFYEMLEIMNDLPVIIRLLDPPLHEFLPRTEPEIEALGKYLGVEKKDVGLHELRHKLKSMSQTNPMLGFRGCRVGVVYPEVPAMQARAIFQACAALKKKGFNPRPRIEVPLVGNVNEFKRIRDVVLAEAKACGVEAFKLDYKIGSMVETPRACVCAEEFAKEVEFFSFGTNDLTQTTCGISRDDAGSFIPEYVRLGIYPVDPFQSIDQSGVGVLMKWAVQKSLAIKPDLDIGICGEHGGEPASIEFVYSIGVKHVSCSPYRVPIAILAGAHATLQQQEVHAKKFTDK